MVLNHFQALKILLYLRHLNLRDLSMTMEAKRISMIKFFRYQVVIIGIGEGKVRYYFFLLISEFYIPFP